MTSRVSIIEKSAPGYGECLTGKRDSLGGASRGNEPLNAKSPLAGASTIISSKIAALSRPVDTTTLTVSKIMGNIYGKVNK